MKSRYFLHFLVIAGMLTGTAGAQALHVETLANGTSMVVVAEPNATATSVAWPVAAGGSVEVRSASGSELTLTAAVDETLGAGPVPPMVVAVGAAQVSDLRALLERSFDGRAPSDVPPEAAPKVLPEGGIERRLVRPGEDSSLLLTLPLPPVEDWRRPPLDVLGEALPELLAREVPDLRVRTSEAVTLELTVDPELAEVQLSRLRLALERLGSAPQLDPAVLEAARSRLLVRRRVDLERQPDSAAALVRLWRSGGLDGVRRFLFGLDGVTPDLVSAAARDWLPQHPGDAQLRLPPRVFNPRFAPGPSSQRLDNDLATAVLERPATALASVCVRPVLTSDLDGEVAATILTRVAGALRSDPTAPGWVQVAANPARLELAANPEGLDELLETLDRALETVRADDTPVAATSTDARRRTLELMAVLLGVGGDLSAATLLRPANLAVGVVAPDHETAAESLTKFLGALPEATAPLESHPLAGEERRSVVPGDESAVAAALPADALNDATTAVLAQLLRERGTAILPKWKVEVLEPLVPGRRLVVVVVSGKGQLNDLEAAMQRTWRRWLGPVTEEALEQVRRRAAIRAALARSGAVGQAREMAAVAAGADAWRTATDRQMAILGTDPTQLSEAMKAMPDWPEMESTGAGPMPAEALPARR